MTTPTDLRSVELESTSRLLRARERSLQHLAQSPRSSGRAGAERELQRVRAELADTYVKMRDLRPSERVGEKS